MNNLPAAGEQLRGYEVLGRIGAGGMGVVLRARDVKLGRIVALKLLPEDMFSNERDKSWLLQEARVVSALDHPNICTIFGLEETSDGRVFIVMGYYDGGTLADRIANGRVPPGAAIDYLLGIASGLAVAHERRIVHRDIKPSNILLTRENVVKIADFGLAKIVSSASETQSADTSGTVAYMSPEQLRGELLDHRVDIWASGVLGAEMASGRHPFKKDNLAAMAYSICHDAPEIPEDIPLELRRVVYKCLSKDPALRYSTCEEMMQDLRRARTHIRVDEPVAIASKPAEDALRQHETSGTGAHGGSYAGSYGAWFGVSLGKDAREKGGRKKALELSMAAAAGRTASPKQGRAKLAAVAGTLVAAVAIAVLAVPALRESVFGSLYTPAETHIAVLPFEDNSGDASEQALAGGLVESLTDALSNLDMDRKSLWVIPASVVRSEKVTDPRAAFKLLKATLVVQGSIAHSGSKVTLTADLINAETLRQIGSASATSGDDDVAAVEQQVLAGLGRLLHVDSPPAALAQGSTGGAPAAYDLYLEALGYMQRFDRTSNLDLAVARLQTAIKQDPSFALGYATLAEAYRLKYKSDNDRKWLVPAEANCETALKLNPRLASALVTLGDIHAATGHLELALTEFQKALSIDDRNSAAVNGLAWSYDRAGNLVKAEAEYKHAIELRPGNWSGPNDLALFYHAHGRFNDAIAQMKQALAITPDNAVAYFNLGAFYLEMGNPEDYPAAERALEKSLSLSPGYQAYTNLALLYLHQMRYADAAAMSGKALALNDTDPLTWVYANLAFRWQNETSKAAEASAHIEKLAEASLSVDPRNGESQSFLGLALAQQGMRENAAPHLRTALALSPTDDQVVVNVIEAYAIMGDDAEAVRTMQKARQQRVSLVDLGVDPGMRKLLSGNASGALAEN